MNPITWIFQSVYGSRPAEFRSDYGLEESISRLQAATARTVFSAPLKESLVGKVSGERVRLQRLIPFVGNSFKPFFLGRFEPRADGVWLTGRFTMLGFVKVFLTTWLTLALVLGTGFALSVSKNNLLLALIPLGFIGFAFGLVRFGQWLSRNDEAWLTAAIGAALVSPISGPAAPPRLSKPRAPLKLFLIIAGGFAVVGLFAGLFAYIDHRIQQSPSYLAARAFLETSPALRAEFGELRSVHYTHNYHIQTGLGAADHIRVTFAIIGAKEAEDVQLAYAYRADLERFTPEHLWVLGDHPHEIPLH